MKQWSINLLSCLALALCVLSVEGRSTHEPREIIKYVKGGACEPGDGTKEHPFTSLAQAQEHEVTWNVLKVLSSPVSLVGPFTLSDGKTLVGEEDPTGTFVSPTQPTITSPNDVAIKVVGNATIRNIRIKGTSTAILYDDAEDLDIESVLIEDYTDWGITADTKQSGKTVLHHVIIRDGMNTATPVFEEVGRGAKRHLSLCNTDISGFSRSAIEVIALDAMTKSHVELKRSSIHHGGLQASGPVCSFQALDRAEQSVHVTSTNFFDVTDTMIDAGAAGGGLGKLHVDSCIFEGNGMNNAVVVVTSDASSKACIENCTGHSLNTFVLAGITDTTETSVASVQSLHVANNDVDAKIFYFSNNISVSGIPATTRTHIVGNNFVGTDDSLSAAISIAFGGIANGWELLDISATNNCFTGGTIAFKAESNTPLNSNTLISAHHNAIVGFTSDITDQGARVTYKVCKNWWGKGAACDPGDCEEFQECKNHCCYGPKNVQVSDPSFVDASNPLDAPIKCPRRCCPDQPVPIL